MGEKVKELVDELNLGDMTDFYINLNLEEIIC